MFELNFRRTMGVRGCDSKCLFSGSRGEVCCLEPLLLHQFTTHPLHGVVFVAMATLSKVISSQVFSDVRMLHYLLCYINTVVLEEPFTSIFRFHPEAGYSMVPIHCITRAVQKVICLIK